MRSALISEIDLHIINLGRERRNAAQQNNKSHLAIKIAYRFIERVLAAWRYAKISRESGYQLARSIRRSSCDRILSDVRQRGRLFAITFSWKIPVIYPSRDAIAGNRWSTRREVESIVVLAVVNCSVSGMKRCRANKDLSGSQRLTRNARIRYT
jgi:hypothetical protein